MASSTVPEAPRPIKAKKRDLRKERKPNWRERRMHKMKWWVTAFLAFVFIVTSVAFFGSSPYAGVAGPAAPLPNTPNQPQDEAKDAIKTAEHSVATNPSAENYTALGDAYFQANRLDDALKAYDKALAQEPDRVVALSHKGSILLRKDDAKGALVVLQKAQDLEKKGAASPKEGETVEGDINIPESLYQAYLLTGDTASAKAQLPIAANIDIEHLVTRAMMPFAEELWIEKNDAAKATEVVDDALQTSSHLQPEMQQQFFMSALAPVLTPMPGKEPRSASYGQMLVKETNHYIPAVGQQMDSFMKVVGGLADSRKQWDEAHDQVASTKTADDALSASKNLPQQMRGQVILQAIVRTPAEMKGNQADNRGWVKMVGAELTKMDPQMGKNMNQIISILSTEPKVAPSGAPEASVAPPAPSAAEPAASASPAASAAVPEASPAASVAAPSGSPQ